MTTHLPQDTPITRASILDMTTAQLSAHVDLMREHRMRGYNLWQEAQAMKAQVKDEKDRAQLDKRCEQLETVLGQAERALDKASKYVNEIYVLKLTLGM